MFKKSRTPQGDLFKNSLSHLSSRKQKLLEDPTSWSKLFYQEVLSRIDESIFSVLYSEKGSRPNASVRTLIGMMLLKEGNGWSDEQLFEECRFNIRVMQALGLFNLDEDVPSESTYYKFRASLVFYYESSGDDLLKKCFQGITCDQIATHQVSGKKVRLDSKLINSNIALSSRLELILEGIRVFIKPLDLVGISSQLESDEYDLLVRLQSKTTTNIVYKLSKEEQGLLLPNLGLVLRVLLTHFSNLCEASSYVVLQRIYQDHYQLVHQEPVKTEVSKEDNNDQDLGKPILKPSKAVDSSSVQSIHDPEATYRSKGRGAKKKHITGYHVNITETCEETNAFNLITDVIVENANVGEDAFLLPSIASSESVLSSKNSRKKVIEEVDTDGAYDNKVNRKKMAEEGQPKWNIRKLKGSPLRFEFRYDKYGELEGIDRLTKQACYITYLPKKKTYKIVYEYGEKRRYFSEEKIEEYILLQTMRAERNPIAQKRRANVEATINQVSHRLGKRDKMKYRGIYKCKMYVYSRASWANFKRISQNIANLLAFLAYMSLTALLVYVNRNKGIKYQLTYRYKPNIKYRLKVGFTYF